MKKIFAKIYKGAQVVLGFLILLATPILLYKGVKAIPRFLGVQGWSLNLLIGLGGVILFSWIFILLMGSWIWGVRHLKKFTGKHTLLMFCMMLLQLLLFINLYFAVLYAEIGIVDNEGRVTKDYGDCLYFSVVTFTTLGYGDFHPTVAARKLVCVQALLGYLFLGLSVGMVLFAFFNVFGTRGTFLTYEAALKVQKQEKGKEEEKEKA